MILLCSGATVTYTHHAITAGLNLEAVWGLVLTIFLAIIFTCFQIFEYIYSWFYNFRWCLWFNFFSCHWFSWFSCLYWYDFFNCLFVTFNVKSFFNGTSFWIWSCSFLLTFCWHCVIISLCCGLFLRWLNLINILWFYGFWKHRCCLVWFKA